MKSYLHLKLQLKHMSQVLVALQYPIPWPRSRNFELTFNFCWIREWLSPRESTNFSILSWRKRRRDKVGPSSRIMISRFLEKCFRMQKRYVLERIHTNELNQDRMLQSNKKNPSVCSRYFSQFSCVSNQYPQSIYKFPRDITNQHLFKERYENKDHFNFRIKIYFDEYHLLLSTNICFQWYQGTISQTHV